MEMKALLVHIKLKCFCGYRCAMNSFIYVCSQLHFSYIYMCKGFNLYTCIKCAMNSVYIYNVQGIAVFFLPALGWGFESSPQCCCCCEEVAVEFGLWGCCYLALPGSILPGDAASPTAGQGALIRQPSSTPHSSTLGLNFQACSKLFSYFILFCVKTGWGKGIWRNLCVYNPFSVDPSYLAHASPWESRIFY